MSSPTKRKIIIAIDGFSSCGKSTFAKEIAARIGYVFIDTGAMYRAVTLYGIEHGAIHDGTVDASQLEALLPQIQISFSFNEQRGASDIYLNGVNVEERIRRIDVSEYVSRGKPDRCRSGADSYTCNRRWENRKESSWTAATSGRSFSRMPS